jgi:nitroreductase
MVLNKTHLSASTVETLEKRVSVRKYKDTRVSDELLHTLIEAARRSPTSSNTQTYSIIVVRDPQTKAKLAELAGNQKHIEAAPVFLAFCADVHRAKYAAQLHGEDVPMNTELALIATIDASLVGMSLSLAAESVGLGTVMIGGMRNKPLEVAEVLGLPEGVYVVYGLCIGYPDVVPAQKPRLPHEVVVHYERYKADGIAPLLEAHDAELAAHYRGEGRETPDAAWTGFIAERFNKPLRAHLKDALARLGFRFE